MKDVMLDEAKQLMNDKCIFLPSSTTSSSDQHQDIEVLLLYLNKIRGLLVNAT